MKTSALLFRLFLILLLTLSSVQSLFSQEYQTLRNIYNYDIGDEFHYHNVKIAGNSISPGLIYDECVNITVAGKYFSSGNDTVFYTENYIASRILWDGTIWDTSMVRQVFYAELDYTLYHFYSYFANPNDSSPNYFNGRIYNYVYQPVWSSGSWNSTFVEGLGETVYNYYYVGQGNYVKIDHDLVYYKKGAEEWGNMYPVSTNNLNFNISSIRLYPNPAIDFTTISRTNTGNAILKISDSQGRTVKIENIEGQTKVLNTSFLNPGLYFITISGDFKTESAILIIQ